MKFTDDALDDDYGDFADLDPGPHFGGVGGGSLAPIGAPPIAGLLGNSNAVGPKAGARGLLSIPQDPAGEAGAGFGGLFSAWPAAGGIVAGGGPAPAAVPFSLAGPRTPTIAAPAAAKPPSPPMDGSAWGLMDPSSALRRLPPPPKPTGAPISVGTPALAAADAPQPAPTASAQTNDGRPLPLWIDAAASGRRGTADERVLQLVAGRSGDPTLQYNPQAGALGRYRPGPSGAPAFEPLTPSQVQMLKEYVLDSNSYAPGVKSPEEAELSPLVGNGPSTTLGQPIGPGDYIPRPGDRNLLSRIIFAEAGDVPGDAAAIGWTGVNRIGKREFGSTLSEVASRPRAYQSIGENSPEWRLSADPSQMNALDNAAWARAQSAADGILSGKIPDPTGGAVNHFNSGHFDGTYRTAPPGFFKQALQYGDLIPTPYRSTGRGEHTNHFLAEPVRKKGSDLNK